MMRYIGEQNPHNPRHQLLNNKQQNDFECKIGGGGYSKCAWANRTKTDERQAHRLIS